VRKKLKEVLKFTMNKFSKVIPFALILSVLLTTGAMALAFEPYESINQPEEAETQPLEPLYDVFKNGARVNACPEIQHMIREFALEHDFCEVIIMAMIVHESTFNPQAHNVGGNWRGLAQISPFWIGNRPIERFTDDYRSRDLFDPYDNLLTLMEMWSYARDRYNLDLSTERGYIQLLFWHSTGQNPTNVRNGTAYTRQVLAHVDEIIEIQREDEVVEVQLPENSFYELPFHNTYNVHMYPRQFD